MILSRGVQGESSSLGGGDLFKLLHVIRFALGGKSDDDVPRAIVDTCFKTFRSHNSSWIKKVAVSVHPYRVKWARVLDALTRLPSWWSFNKYSKQIKDLGFTAKDADLAEDDSSGKDEHKSQMSASAGSEEDSEQDEQGEEKGAADQDQDNGEYEQEPEDGAGFALRGVCAASGSFFW